MLQDAVDESSPASQCDPQSSMMASMRAELPRLPVLQKGGNSNTSTADFRGSSTSSSGARSWLQRSHIQRDEADPPRRVSNSWSNTNSERLRPSASAMVLARKRKRDEQRKLLGGKKQCADSDGSAGDSERDSLDMEEQLTAFVEYNATDMDSLDINPSQDFDGDEEQDIVAQAAQCMQTCAWEDITDANQLQEEASEVFDNVIYAPRPAAIPVVNSASTHCRVQGKSQFGIACPTFLPAAKAIPEKRAVVGPPSDDSEGSLSDGFDVTTNVASRIKAEERPPTVNASRCTSSPKPESKHLWRQRRSVKRDCSFLDNSSYSVNGRLLLMASPAPATATETSKASTDKIIELKDGCFDSSDDVKGVPLQQSEAFSSLPPATVDTMTVISPPFASSSGSSSASTGFHPRLVRKRRKVGQLTLDGFFRAKRS